MLVMQAFDKPSPKQRSVSVESSSPAAARRHTSAGDGHEPWAAAARSVVRWPLASELSFRKAMNAAGIGPKRSYPHQGRRIFARARSTSARMTHSSA